MEGCRAERCSSPLCAHASTQQCQHHHQQQAALRALSSSGAQAARQRRVAASGRTALPLLLLLLVLAAPAPRGAVAADAAVSALTADVDVLGVPLKQVLSGFLKHNFSLPVTQLRRAAVYTGPNQRLRGLLRRALDGTLPHNNTLRVGIIGGSIGWGHGASERGATDFFSLFVAYLRTALPNTKIVSRNGCMPGTPSAYMTMCLEQHIDEEVDLLFIEYTLNDGFDDNVVFNSRVRVMERLIRRVLSKPHYPATIMLQMPSHGQAFRRDASDWRDFHHTPEDLYGGLALYYDVLWLSARQAFLNRLGNGEDPQSEAEGGMAFMAPDGLHPSDKGHRALADAAAWVVQQTALGMALAPVAKEEWEYLERRALPRPMHRGNHHHVHRTCLYEKALKPAIAYTKGFSLVNEGTKSKPKWGYVARRPGAELRLNISTETPKPPERSVMFASTPAAETVAVYVAHLKSYEHMGVAEISCVSGCVCDPKQVNALQQAHESQTHLARLDATKHPNCVIRVVVSERSDSDAFKFKVSGVMVSEKSPTGEAFYNRPHNDHWSMYSHLGEEAQRHPTGDGRLDRHLRRRLV